MAKQSGLHQIKGKVGEYSYYKQTGVQGGLIRGINQGLSARVKTGAEYANTRLNNDEFGQACRVASKLISYITPKYRPMILPFSQAKLAKDLLQIIKESAGNWGERNISDTDGAKVAPFVSALAKNNFEEYGISLLSEDGVIKVSVDDILSVSKLQAIGADGYLVRVVLTNTWIGKYLQSGKAYVTTSAHSNMEEETVTPGETVGLGSLDYPAGPTLPTLQDACKNVFIVVMPYRIINNTNYILQESCTFKAFAEIAIV